MASCIEMEEGDIFVCETCGLELQVTKACACTAGEEVSCTVPLQCCGKDMVKKQIDLQGLYFLSALATASERLLPLFLSKRNGLYKSGSL